MKKTFGQWVRDTRTKQKLSVRDLASFVGTSASSIWQTEHEINTPRLVTASKIADAMGYPLWKALKQIEESGNGKRAAKKK